MSTLPPIAGIAKTTYSGSLIEPVTLGLPKIVESICPECRRIIQAREFEEDGKVLMEKICPVHGSFKDIIFSDVEIYRRTEEWFFGDGKGLKNPIVENAVKCPDQCGICNLHTSHTAVGNIDLTNRCNLTCPVCFANANAAGYLYEPSFEQVVRMLKAYRQEQPVPAICVQFSGGEPTLHPQFFEILQAAKKMGFDHIQAATNGLKLCDMGFAQKCAESGLHTVYLQFDGMADDVYLKLRGRSLLEKKLKIVENVRRTNMLIILVPTVVKGINDHQIGAIVDFALDNLDVITGISFQPVAFTGRISNENILQQRVTLSDLAIWVEQQTGYADAKNDWFPLSALTPFSKLGGAISGKEVTTVSCHPHCALCTYFFVDKKTSIPIPVTRFVDLKEMLFKVKQLSENAPSTGFQFFSKIKLWNETRKYFHSGKAPNGLTFSKFLQALDGHSGKEVSRRHDFQEHIYPNLFVAGMHFMDAYNYDLQRIRRCVVHYSTPDGRIYPFCAYNSGPMFREMAERKFSGPIQG